MTRDKSQQFYDELQDSPHDPRIPTLDAVTRALAESKAIAEGRVLCERGKHHWLEVTVFGDAGRRSLCGRCGAETIEPF